MMMMMIGARVTLHCMLLQPQNLMTYIDEGGIKDDLGTVVEDIDEGFTNAGKAFDGFLDGASAGGATHTHHREKGLPLLRGPLLGGGVPWHRRVVWLRR